MICFENDTDEIKSQMITGMRVTFRDCNRATKTANAGHVASTTRKYESMAASTRARRRHPALAMMKRTNLAITTMGTVAKLVSTDPWGSKEQARPDAAVEAQAGTAFGDAPFGSCCLDCGL